MLLGAIKFEWFQLGFLRLEYLSHAALQLSPSYPEIVCTYTYIEVYVNIRTESWGFCATNWAAAVSSSGGLDEAGPPAAACRAGPGAGT